MKVVTAYRGCSESILYGEKNTCKKYKDLPDDAVEEDDDTDIDDSSEYCECDDSDNCNDKKFKSSAKELQVIDAEASLAVGQVGQLPYQ